MKNINTIINLLNEYGIDSNRINTTPNKDVIYFFCVNKIVIHCINESITIEKASNGVNLGVTSGSYSLIAALKK